MSKVAKDGIGLVDATGIKLIPQTPTQVTVGLASGLVLAQNLARRGVIMVNISTNRISLGFGQAAILDSGAVLMGSGGVFNMGELDFWQGDIFAIASGAGSTLTIQEFL